MLLSVRKLSKRFGQTHAVRDAALDLQRGEIVALLGPNGAGKTTLLECIAGVVAADAGVVNVEGIQATEQARRRTLFYLPDAIAPWAAQPAGWVLDFTGALFGSRASIAERRDVIGTLRTDELASQPVGTLSKGQRKRLLLAITLLVPQQVLLLDEPFDGLDLRFTRDAIALLRRVRDRGRSMILSVHSMSDAERVADRLLLMHDGRVVADGSATELRARTGLPDAALEEVFLALT